MSSRGMGRNEELFLKPKRLMTCSVVWPLVVTDFVDCTKSNSRSLIVLKPNPPLTEKGEEQTTVTSSCSVTAASAARRSCLSSLTAVSLFWSNEKLQPASYGSSSKKASFCTCAVVKISFHWPSTLCASSKRAAGPSAAPPRPSAFTLSRRSLNLAFTASTLSLFLASHCKSEMRPSSPSQTSTSARNLLMASSGQVPSEL